jgi:hypothetical protein
MILDNNRIPPALSAMLINPMNKAIIPINLKAIFTAVQHVSIIPSIFSGFAGSSALLTTIQLKISVLPKKKHLYEATTIATMIKAAHILLRAINVYRLEFMV